MIYGRKLWTAIALVATGVAVGGTADAHEFVTNGDFTQLSAGPGEFGFTTVTGWSGNGGYNFVFAQADQAVNGQFGSVALWDQANGGANTWNGLAAGPGNFAALDGDFLTEAITQTITGLKPGGLYALSFDYAFGQQAGLGGATVQSLAVGFGAGCCGNSGDFDIASHGFSGWQSAGILVKADATSDVLSFLANGTSTPPFALVSNVSLVDIPAPEPVTLSLMAAGLAGAAAMRRRRGGA